jgi:MFS family permease
MAVHRPAKRLSVFSEIPMSIWAMGFVSLLVNSSSVIIFSYYPEYATQVLGITLTGLGFIEGLVEALSWFMRLFAGVISDYMHRRKPLLMIAYSLMVLSRFIFPTAKDVSSIVTAKTIDRIANGLQASPRDALIGDAAPHHLKGSSYGLQKTLALIGSCASAALFMYLFRQIKLDYQLAFWLTLIPSTLAVMILYFFVKDRIDTTTKKEAILRPFHLSEALALPQRYWLVISIASFFMISNYSGVFMILHTKTAGLEAHDITLVMVIQNLAAFLSAFPMGWLSDKLGRLWFLALGFVTVIVSNLFLSTTDSLPLVLVGVALWGVQIGINQSIIPAKVAESTPLHVRGTAFGIYYIFVGIALFISNTVSGWISDQYGVQWVFYASSVVAFLALLLLPLLRRHPKPMPQAVAAGS